MTGPGRIAMLLDGNDLAIMGRRAAHDAFDAGVALLEADSARLEWMQTHDLGDFAVPSDFVQEAGRNICKAIDSMRMEQQRAEMEVGVGPFRR